MEDEKRYWQSPGSMIDGMKGLQSLARAASRRIRLARVEGMYARFANRWFARHFVPNLLTLHDVLAKSELEGKYWIWAGMLLGWAREGQLLPHDRDADFGVLREDLPKLLAVVPLLRNAGYEPHSQFKNNEGLVTELAFRRHGAKFEFFVFEHVEGMLRYFVYGWPPDHLIQVEARIPDQTLVSLEFLGRTWLRHADHDLELRSMYGDWRTPQENWNYLRDDRAAISEAPWTNPNTAWSL